MAIYSNHATKSNKAPILYHKESLVLSINGGQKWCECIDDVGDIHHTWPASAALGPL